MTREARHRESLPSAADLLWPTLETLKRLGGAASNQEILDSAAESLGISSSLQAEMRVDGQTTELYHRLALARTYLKASGAIQNPRRGEWTLTRRGRRMGRADVIGLTARYQDSLRARENGVADATELADSAWLHRSAAYLHGRILLGLGDLVRKAPPLAQIRVKPLDLRLSMPLPPKARFYAYLATTHPSERSIGDYRIQVIVPGWGYDRAYFDRSDGAVPILVGYIPELDVHVLWDADLHDAGIGIPYSKGVQVHAATIYRAAAEGMAEQHRTIRGAFRRSGEIVVAVRRSMLVEGLVRRRELSLQALLERAR
jgi:hypothetical protein